MERVLRRPRVLPADHAERMQVPLGLQQGLFDLTRCWRGDVPLHEGHRSLVQRARREAVRFALDAAVGRVRRTRVQARELQGAGVHPRVVAVAVREEDGPVGDHGVQGSSRWVSAGEVVQRPAGPQDPGHVTVRRRVPGHGAFVVVDASDLVQVAPHPGQAAVVGMHVSVLEPGEDGAAVDVHHLGGRPDQVADLPIGAHGRDPAAPNRYPFRATRARVERDDPSADQGKVGRRRCGLVRHPRDLRAWGRTTIPPRRRLPVVPRDDGPLASPEPGPDP